MALACARACWATRVTMHPTLSAASACSRRNLGQRDRLGRACTLERETMVLVPEGVEGVANELLHRRLAGRWRQRQRQRQRPWRGRATVSATVVTVPHEHTRNAVAVERARWSVGPGACDGPLERGLGAPVAASLGHPVQTVTVTPAQDIDSARQERPHTPQTPELPPIYGREMAPTPRAASAATALAGPVATVAGAWLSADGRSNC